MKKYNPGDKVQIKSWKKRPGHWNSGGRMDKWCGKIVTIRNYATRGRYHIVEDVNDRADTHSGWFWEERDFLPVEYLEDDLFSMD
jgi:hypothetical protein